MTKRKQRTRAERSSSVFKVLTQHYINKCRPTYFNLRILPKIYDFRLRLSLWIYPKADCFGCCLTCKYFNSDCRDEFAGRWER